MSFDKFPADIAIEFLAEEAQEAPGPVLKTAEDLLQWVANDPTLKRQDRVNQMSAIRLMGTIDNTPLSAIPLDVRYLLDDRYRKIRDDKSRKPRRKSGIINLLNRVLKRAGIIKVGSRRSGRLSHAWIQLIQSLPTREDQRGISTFARFCSGRGIEPHQVTLDVWDRFVDETLNHSGFRKPRATVCRTISACNRARAKNGDWSLPKLPKLVNPRRVSLPRATFPTSLWDDFDAYARKSSTPTDDIFDTTQAKQLAPDTLKRYREVAWRTASAQVHQGRPVEEIVSLAALLDIPWLKEAMRRFHAHAGGKFLKDHLNIAATWVSFATNYVRPPEAEVEALRKIMGMIAKQLGPPEFSRRNIERLDQFNAPNKAEELLLLPFTIFDEVRRKKVITVDDATDMMAAVGIEILLATMVRLKNLANTDLTKNFWPAKPRSDGTWVFRVERKDVKNKQHLDFKLSRHTVRLIEFYLEKCRPLLMKEPTSTLFLRADGTPKGRDGMANLVVKTVRRRLGLEVNTHLYRHIGAMLYLNQHPDLETVRIMLGHTSIRTTERFYARLKATRAIELFTKAVLGGRDATIDKLWLGRRRKA